MLSFDGKNIDVKREWMDISVCTRWEELKNTVSFHARLAGLLEAPTEFQLMNCNISKDETNFYVAQSSPEMICTEIEKINNVMNQVEPSGNSPLTRKVVDARERVRAIKNQLIQDGKRVVIVLATDGLPTDEDGNESNEISQEFLDALQSLQNLPIWLVLRLCTSDPKVIRYYEELDSELNIRMDVLLDFVSEAKNVRQYNPWLNYGLPLHQCREMGFCDQLFDFIDSRPLSRDELKDFFSHLFGAHHFESYDPAINFRDFLDKIKRIMAGESEQFHPIKKKMRPWVSLKKLEEIYGGGGCSLM